jgi:hypothetical protein
MLLFHTSAFPGRISASKSLIPVSRPSFMSSAHLSYFSYSYIAKCGIPLGVFVEDGLSGTVVQVLILHMRFTHSLLLSREWLVAMAAALPAG